MRAAIAFAVLWVLARASGRGTLGELSSFDLLLFITMGDLVQQGITMDDRSLTGGILAVATFAVLALLLNYSLAFWPRLGRLVSGRPIVLVRDGVVDERAMRAQHVDRSELETATRQQSIASFDDVHLAILEPNGKISFFRHQDAA